MCGEKAPFHAWLCCIRGSPPRVRGKVRLWLLANAFDRITPACAGKRAVFWARVASWEDHPRVCGEKFHFLSQSTLLMGSPPRVRGKAGGGIENAAGLGITPACAGKRDGAGGGASVGLDHPRVCGEKKDGAQSCTRLLGSPPRVRGKVVLFCVESCLFRITPARAGKRTERWQYKTNRKDHPRACGEKLHFNAGCPVLTGSPPRVRGKARPQQLQGFCLRITPARAGKSSL